MVIRSMTAFARQEQQETWGQICWELRSVNHRYLEISTRLPEEFRRLEPKIREKIQRNLKRGKVDCNLRFQTIYAENTQLQVNLVLVQRLWEAIKTVDQLTGNVTLPSSIELLRWPGVLESMTLDIEQMSEIILHHLDKALTELIAQREREGTQLALFLEQRCAAVAVEVEQVRGELPGILQLQRERLQTRLNELLTQLDHDRIEQEIAIMAQKMDVAEELERLETHLIEIRQTLAQGQAVGRRLDFLVQELYREANTLGSKSNHLTTSRSAVELKVLIEQMREQIQNIE